VGVTRDAAKKARIIAKSMLENYTLMESQPVTPELMLEFKTMKSTHLTHSPYLLTLTHSPYSLTHSLTHSPTHSLTHSLTYSLTLTLL